MGEGMQTEKYVAVFFIAFLVLGLVVFCGLRGKEMWREAREAFGEKEEKVQEDTDDYEIENNVLVRYYGEKEILNIPEGVTQIASFAVKSDSDLIGDVKLEKIIIPESVQTIDESAFTVNRFLKEIVFEGIPDTKNMNEGFHFYEMRDNLTLFFKSDFRYSFTLFDGSAVPDDKENECHVDMSWARVDGADGYEIRFEGYKREDSETVCVSGEKTSLKKVIEFSPSVGGLEVYIKPYQNVDGEKVYGRTTYDDFDTEEYFCE